jgi:hypothetical protein
MRGCCRTPENSQGPQKTPKVFLLGALTFLLPKCPLCIPGFMALLGAAGLQIGFGVGLLFALKCLAAIFLLWAVAALLRVAHFRRKAKRLMKAASVNIS